MKREAMEWLDRFERYLVTERRVSPNTVSSYRRQLRALREFCEANQLDHWPDVDVGQIRTFLARSSAGGLAPQSVQHRLSAMRSFFQFLIREGVLAANPAK